MRRERESEKEREGEDEGGMDGEREICNNKLTETEEKNMPLCLTGPIPCGTISKRNRRKTTSTYASL